MNKNIKILCFSALVSLLPAASYGAASDLIEDGDEVYAQRTETSGADKALDIYQKALQEDPAHVEAAWRIARSYYWLADHSTSTKLKLRLFQDGIAAANKAIEMDPKSVEAHFWLGGLYGSYGEAKGVLKSLALVKPIRKEMDTIIRLDDKFQGGAGYRVNGIVDYKVPGFAGGSKKRALENLNKALAIDPDNAFNRYYLAEYFHTIGDKQKTLEHLNALEKLEPTKDVDSADLKMMKERGQKLRAKL